MAPYCTRTGDYGQVGPRGGRPDRALTAGGVHEAQNLRLTVVVEMVALGLDLHGIDDGLLEPRQAVVGRPQDLAQVYRMFVAQAQQQAPSTVTRTRLHRWQKLLLWGDIKPMREGLSAMR